MSEAEGLSFHLAGGVKISHSEQYKLNVLHAHNLCIKYKHAEVSCFREPDFALVISKSELGPNKKI